MVLLLIVCFLGLVFLIIREFGLFPYYSYFKNGQFWIKELLVIERNLDLKKVIKADINTLSTAEWFINSIQLFTLSETINIRTIGLFSYKSDINLLKQIKEMNKNIDMSGDRIKRYIMAGNNSRTYINQEHVHGIASLVFSLVIILMIIFGTLMGS